jgi:hypothetical protein
VGGKVSEFSHAIFDILADASAEAAGQWFDLVRVKLENFDQKALGQPHLPDSAQGHELAGHG